MSDSEIKDIKERVEYLEEHKEEPTIGGVYVRDCRVLLAEFQVIEEVKRSISNQCNALLDENKLLKEVLEEATRLVNSIERTNRCTSTRYKALAAAIKKYELN